ncbi:lonely Cys domain-containing protein [Streptomyces sp. NPDC001980]|uniref:lonely Cys domain-containing protein n=1 Tax=Streptomyces sp. NPDC001980 TaxID=3157126 RepID=UPI00331A83A7
MSDDTFSPVKNWDPNPVYELGNALIDFGDFLDEQAARMTDAEFDLNLGAWQGDAEMWMTQAFSDQREAVMEIIEEFWDTGEMINYYAMLRTEQEATLAKQSLSELIAGIVGVLLGALLFVAPELLGLLGAAAGLLAEVGGMMGSIFTFLVNVGKSVGQFVGSAAAAVGETLPDWVVTMAGVTGNVARFGIEFMGVNAASVAAGNAAAGLQTTAQQLIPVPTSLEQIPGFISDLVLWGGIGVAVASAAKGLVNVAREKLDILKADMNVGDVNVGAGDVGTSVGNSSTGTGTGTGLTLPSSVTSVSSVSGTIADSSKGLTKSDLTLSSDVEINSAVTQTLTGTTVRTSVDTAPAPTPTKVTTTGAADGPNTDGGTAVPNKVTPVDAGTSPGGSSAVRTVTDGSTQPVQPAPKTETAGGNANTITSGATDGSTGQSVLHDVGSGLSGVAKTAQAAQRTVDASTAGHSTGGQESVGASGAGQAVRTNLDAQPSTATPHEVAPQTPSPTTDAAGGRVQDTGSNAVPGVGKAVDAGVRQAQSALRAVGDNHAATPDTGARTAGAEETVSPVQSVASGKPEVVHPTTPVREASVGQVEGGGRTGTPQTAGSTAPRSAAGEQGARGTADGGAAARDIGTRANLGDTAVRSGTDQGQRVSGAAEGTRTVPNAGREPLKSAAGPGGRQVRPAGRADARSASGEGGDSAAFAGPAKDRTTPVEAADGILRPDGTVHGASARAASEADGAGQTRTGAPGETSRAQRGADEARSATRSEEAESGRTAPEGRSVESTVTQAERQRVADFREAAKRQRAEDRNTAAVREEADGKTAGAPRAEAVVRAEETRAGITGASRAEAASRSVDATSRSADATSRSATAKSADATDVTDASGAAHETTQGQAGDHGSADRTARHDLAATGTDADPAHAQSGDRAGEQSGHEQVSYDYRHDVSEAKNAAYEEAQRRQNETYEGRLAEEAERAEQRLQHNQRLWNAFDDVRGDLSHEYPAVRSEAVTDIEAVVRGEGVSDRYAEGMADSYRKAVEEHQNYLKEHPEKRADELQVGIDHETGAVSHSPLQAKLVKALESVLDDSYRGPSPVELVEAIRRSSDESSGPKDWARKLGVPEDLVSTVASAYHEARFEQYRRAGETDPGTHAFEEALTAKLEDHLGNLEHDLSARSLADRMIREENRFQSGQPRPWREEVKQRLETRLESIEDAVQQGDISARQGEAAKQSLYEGLPQEFALEAAVRQLRDAASEAFDRALTHPDRPGGNLFVSEALFDRRPFSAKDEANLRTDFLDEFTADLRDITRQLELDGNLVHRDFMTDLVSGAQPRFDAMVRGLETRLTLAEDATRTFDAMADARGLDRNSDDIAAVRKDFLDEYAQTTGELADGRPVRELTSAEYADAAHQFNRALSELGDRWAGRLDAKAAERALREQADELRGNRYVASRNVTDKILADYGKALDDAMAGILGSRRPEELSADDWAAYTAELSQSHILLMRQTAPLHAVLEKADYSLHAAAGVRKGTELDSQAKRVQDDMYKTLADAYREHVGMPEEGQWSAEELNARETAFNDAVLDPYTRSLDDRLAYESAFDEALADGGRRFNELTSKVDEAAGTVSGRYALNGYDLGKVADDFRSDAGQAHQEIYGPNGRDVEAALGTERADGDVFGTARGQAWRDLVHEVEMPRHRAEQETWRAQLRQRFTSLEAESDVRRQVETHASAIGSQAARRTFQEDSRQVLDSFKEEMTGARTPDDLGTAVRTAQEKIQALYDDAAKLDTEYRQWRQNPEWKVDLSRLTVERAPFKESGRPHEQAAATSARGTGSADARTQQVSLPTDGPGRALADLGAGLELRAQVYQEFEQRLADTPAFRQTIPYTEQVQAREWFADRWTQAAQQPDTDHDTLRAELDARLARDYSQAKATAEANAVFDREVALSSAKLRLADTYFGSSRVARSIRDDFRQAMAAAITTGQEDPAPELVQQFRQQYQQASRDWWAEEFAREEFRKALSLPDGVDLTRGRPSWAQEQRAWYGGRLRELREQYTAEWLAAGQGRPPAETVGRLDAAVRNVAARFLTRAESMGDVVRQATELTRARSADSDWSEELAFWHKTQQAALVNGFVAYEAGPKPDARIPAMAELAFALDALREAARVRHLAHQDLADALSDVRIDAVTVTSDAVAGWARQEIGRIREEHVRAFEETYWNTTEPVPSQQGQGQGQGQGQEQEQRQGQEQQQSAADGLSASALSELKADVNRVLREVKWPYGSASTAKVAHEYAELPTYWRKDPKSTAEVTARAVMGLRLGMAPGGAPGDEAEYTSSGDVGAASASVQRLVLRDGGLPDTGVDPYTDGWPIGQPVVLEGPRRVGKLTEVPAPTLPLPTGEGEGKGKAREQWFTYRRPSPLGSAPVEYDVSDMGSVRMPSGEVLSADGWVRYGGDFVHPASGALLFGDTGWLGQVYNRDELLEHPGFPAPGTARHTLVADSSYIHLVPTGPAGTRGATAVRITLDPDGLAGTGASATQPTAEEPATTDPATTDPATEDQAETSAGASSEASAEASAGTSADSNTSGEAPVQPPVPENVVTPPDDVREPWYLSFGALGQAVVPDSVKQIKFTEKRARLWAGRVSQSLVLPGPGPHDALRAGIRDEVQKLLLDKKPKDWDNVLAVGHTVVVDGRLVWLRPMVRALTPVPPKTGDVSEYPVGFAVTQTGGETSRETVQGADSILFTALNLGTSVAASIAALAVPQVLVGSSKEKSNSWGQTILSGRKPFINKFNRFTAGLEMHVFVGGEEATQAGRLVTVPDRVHVDLPAPYSEEGQHQPDLNAPERPRPVKPRRTGPSQARELLNAVNLTPAIAGLHRNLLAAGLPAPHVKKIMTGLGMDKSQGFLSEPTARNRYAWWAGGDVSNSIEVSGPLGKKFQGHLRIQATVDSLQYLGDTNVATRDDIGAGFSRTASTKGASVAGLGGGYNTAGIGGGGSDASAAGTDPETTPGQEAPEHESVEVKGVAPAVGASVSGDRGAGYSLDTAHMSHTVLNVFGDQSRYRTGLRLTATMESSTHNIAPVVVTTESEQSVPQREAAQFVEGTVGPGWTADLRPADGGENARRHRVFALPARRQVKKLPTVRSPFRFGMGVSGPGLLPPHPREPLPLAARRGLGFGMPIALPGSETLQQDLRDAIERHHVKAAGAKKASKSDWANADRDLAMFYGRSALEADPNQALLGIHRTIEVGGHRYKVSAKMSWGDRVTGANPLTGPVNEDNPLGQTYTMKVNARVVNGATVAGERGKGSKARFAFGGGARLAIPEHEFNIGSLHLKTPPFRLAVGAFRGLLSRSWGKSDKFAGLAKEYRRTETAKKVDEHRYGMTLQWTVTPEARKPSYLSGSNPATARVVVPHEHVPAEPVSLKQAQAAGRAEVTGERPATERPLDFSSGTHGLYPVFHLMPELAQLGARMYARQHGLPDSWLHNPAEWPEEIRDLAHPGILTARFGAMTGSLGHQSELPKDGRHKQAFRVRLHTRAPSDLGRSPDVEVEHYAQAAASHAVEKEGEWALGLAGSVGPQFRFGADANDEEGHHGGLGGRLTVLGYGEAAKKWGDGSGKTAGRIDITRATYSGDVHTVRTTPVFEVTYVRWRGKELTETTEFLTADAALDLLTPERRLSDIMPAGVPAADATRTAAADRAEAPAAGAAEAAAPATVPAIVITSPEGEESAVGPAPAAYATTAAAPAPLPTIVVTPPDVEEHATDPGTAAAATASVPDPARLSPTAREQSVAPPPRTRGYLHQDLISGIGHPEVMRADGILDAITDRLRGRGVVTTERVQGVGPRPNLLMRSLSSSFSADALRSEWYALTTNQGVSRWFPVPGPFGTTRYLWVKVTATRLGAAAGQRPRDDIKLTLRGESVDEKSKSEASGSEFSGGLDLRGRIGAGSLHGGLEGGAEYSTSRGEADEEAEKTVKIYRANPKDASEEFNHDLTFRVEMGATTELPEALTLPARGVGRITRLFTGAPSRDKGVFTWYDAGDGTPGNAPQVEGGSVRLLVPRHLTAAVEAWPEPIDLTGARETEVSWTPGPKPNTLKRRNPAQPAEPRPEPTQEQPAAPAPQVSEPAPAQETVPAQKAEQAEQVPKLPDALLENLHPWSVPAAAAIGRWAAVTAVRHRTPPALDVAAPPHVSGLNFTTRAGLRYQHYTSGNMLRPHIKELLNQTYEVPVGAEKAVVGLEVDGAEILGPPEGTLIKQRTYTQTDEEPKHEVEKESGWQFTLGPEMGGSLGDHKMFDRLPITIKNWMNGRKRTTAVGDTDERNKEGQRHYRLYRFDVTAVVEGPHGTVRVKVPNGLFGMLPIDKATGRLADGLEDWRKGLLAPPPLPAPPMPARPAPAPPVPTRPVPTPPMPTRPAPAPPVPTRTSSLATKTSRPAQELAMEARPAPAPPVPARTSSLSARTARPAPELATPVRPEPEPVPPVPSPTPTAELSPGEGGYRQDDDPESQFRLGTAALLEESVTAALRDRFGLEAVVGLGGGGGVSAVRPVRSVQDLDLRLTLPEGVGAEQRAAVMRYLQDDVLVGGQQSSGTTVRGQFGDVEASVTLAPVPVATRSLPVVDGPGTVDLSVVDTARLFADKIIAFEGRKADPSDPNGAEWVLEKRLRDAADVLALADRLAEERPLSETMTGLLEGTLPAPPKWAEQKPARFVQALGALHNARKDHFTESQWSALQTIGRLLPNSAKAAKPVTAPPTEQERAAPAEQKLAQRKAKKQQAAARRAAAAAGRTAPGQTLDAPATPVTEPSPPVRVEQTPEPEPRPTPVAEDATGTPAPAPAPQPSGPRRALLPAPERLDLYVAALKDGDAETPGSREAMWAKRSTALTAAGVDIPPRFVQIEDVTVGYTPAEENGEANAPLSGAKFMNSYGRTDDGTTLAVMGENYRAPGEGFTAADAFIHQWSTAHVLLAGEKLSAKKLATAVGKDLERPKSAADLPERLPHRIYRQNISGPAAKKALGGLLDAETSTRRFTAGDESFEQVLRTVNGKSTNNIVKTFNELKGYSGDDAHLITGGALFRDSNGNFQLRFEIVRAADVAGGAGTREPAAKTTAPDEEAAAALLEILPTEVVDTTGSLDPGARPELISSMPAGPLTDPGKSALSAPAQSDTSAAAASADGRGAVDPAVSEGTASSEPWTTGKVTFKEGSEEVDPLQRGYLTHLARKVVKAGLRDIRAGLQAPWITVTGYGNGSWLTPASPGWGAESRGQGRADAVADVLRDEIWKVLKLIQQNEPPERHVSSSAFTIVGVSGGRDVAVDGVSGDAGVRALRRQTTIDIDLAPRSQAVERLDALRLADTGTGLREGAFDPDPLARRILHLDAQHTVRDTDRRALYALVDEAIAAGRATSLAALGAYDLWRRGALSDASRITAADGRALGRNWTGGPAGDLLTESYVELREGRVADSPTALWQQQGADDNRPYLVAAKGDHERVRVRLTGGSLVRVPLEEFAELLAMDPDLAALDDQLPVVLAVPHAGARSPRLPRTAAARTGRTVWAHSGEVKLHEDPSTRQTRIAVVNRRSAGEPLGSWFASEPDRPGLVDQVPGIEERFLRAVDGTRVPDDEIMSHTLAADGRPYGRAVFTKGDVIARERQFGTVSNADKYVHVDPVSQNLYGDAENVPWFGRDAYFFYLHGNPGAFQIARADGTARTTPGDQIGGYLRRRPSLRRLTPDGVVVLMSCWAGAAADGISRRGDAARAPFAADRLATVSEAQQVANQVDRTVFAVDRAHYVSYSGGQSRQGIAMTAEGERSGWKELRPEPTGAALDELARTVGLHTGAGPASEEDRDSALRLVRALRLVFGASVEDDKDVVDGEYQRLLSGIGALETMRRDDPGLRDSGPFTMDLLDRVARSHAEQSAGLAKPPGTALEPAEILAVLEAARTQPARAALRDFVPLPSVDEALSTLAKDDPAQRAVQVLDLGSGPVTAVHRQRLLWATVGAVEGLSAAPDVNALAVKVLHLDASVVPVDDARRAELLWTMAGAAAAGRDVHNPTALAAFHLERSGALSRGTLLLSSSGREVGRNWTGRPMTDPLVMDRYLATDTNVGPSSAAVLPVPWRLRGAGTGENAYFVLADGGRDHVDMPWPDGSRRPVPPDEIAELLANDPVLNARLPEDPIVPIMPNTPRSAPLMRALTDRAATGRTVFMPAVNVALFHSTRRNEYDIVVAEPAHSGATAGWVRKDPPALVPPAPAAPAVPVTTTVSATSAPEPFPSMPVGPLSSPVRDAGAVEPATADATASSRPWTTEKVTFEEGSKEVAPARRDRLAALARKAAEAGLRDIRDGLQAPWITVTGYGNGSRLGGRGADSTGRERADAVADVLRTEIGNALRLLQNGDASTAGRVAADAFRIDSVSGGRDLADNGASGGAGTRDLRRQAVIEIDLAPRSPAIEKLNALRLADPDPAQREVPFDPDQLARRILHLDGPVRNVHRRALYALVDEATAAGRATSLAALGAYDLWRRGALSDASRITAPDGRALGRSWTGGAVIDLAAESYVQVRGSNTVDAPTVPWQQQGPGDHRPYVISAKGDHERVRVRLTGGSLVRVPLEEFAELLAMDPDLAALDAQVPVLLVVPHAGARSPRLPRTAAARTGRTVWAHGGHVKLHDDAVTGRARIVEIDHRDLGHPLGSWFASRPGRPEPENPTAGAEQRYVRTVDGTLVPDDEILSHTLTTDGRPYGRAVLSERDMAERDEHVNALPEANEYEYLDPVRSFTHGDKEKVPWAGRTAYYFYLHGQPGAFRVVKLDGTSGNARGDQVAGYLQRRPSFQELAPDDVVVLMSCWAGAPADTLAVHNRAGRTPFVADPLATVSEAQQVANHVDRTVFAIDRVHFVRSEGKESWQGILTDSLGERRKWLELRPEPIGASLDELARTAGLHTGEGPASEQDRVTTLRLVRALRLVFGASVEDDKDDAHGEYQRLLAGIGALARMRRDDPLMGDVGPFTMDLLHRVARAYLGRSAGLVRAPGTALDPADVRAVLEAARTQPDHRSLTGFVWLPSLGEALSLVGKGDPDQRAVEVLDLESGPVTDVHRQRLLWATVKAVEGLAAASDVDAVAAKVLHLGSSAGPVDDARRAELLWTMAGAAAAGRDVHNPTALAAFHLERAGALSADTLLGPPTRALGRNWTGRPLTGRLVTDNYLLSGNGTDPAGASPRTAPWLSPQDDPDELPRAFFVLADGGPDHIDMSLPNGTRPSVPHDEIAELLTNDQLLSAHPPNEPVVPLVPHSGGGRALATALTNRAATGRGVLRPAVDIDLFHNRKTKEHHIVVAEPAPGASSTSGWVRTLPPPLAAPTPAKPAAPAVTEAPAVAPPRLPAVGTTEIVEGPMPNAAVPADAADIIPPPILSRGGQVFLADDRLPEEIIAAGLVPMGPSLDLDSYAQAGSGESAAFGFVAAGASREQAAQRLNEGYVWEVDAPGGIDVAATLDAYGIPHKTAAGAEVLFAGGVASRYIKGAWRIVPGAGAHGENTLGEWIPNPNHRSYDDGRDVTPAAPVRRLPIQPVLDKRVFRVEDVVSPDELLHLADALGGADAVTGEQYAGELGARLTAHIKVELAEQGLAVGHVDLHVSMDDPGHSMAGMALARVVANGLGRRAMLTVGALRTPVDICPSRN